MKVPMVGKFSEMFDLVSYFTIGWQISRPYFFLTVGLRFAVVTDAVVIVTRVEDACVQLLRSCVHQEQRCPVSVHQLLGVVLTLQLSDYTRE